MKTQIVYVLIGSEKNLFLEELWVSIYSLRHYHPNVKVTVLTDDRTAKRIKERPALETLITVLKVIPMPDYYDDRFRSRTLKTNMRNLIEGDFLFIDTDTIICQSLEDIDNLNINNIAMVPEMHGTFKEHLTYDYISHEVKRVFGTDVSDAKYWFNSGCMYVKDNDLTHKFFDAWNANWKYSSQLSVKENSGASGSSDQRPLLKTDCDFGHLIEKLPDIYNCQLAMSIKYLHEAKIIHFWHMRGDFTPMQEYSPFTSKEIYRKIRTERGISKETATTIVNAKSSFDRISMVVGESDRQFLFSGFHSILWKAYNDSSFFHWFFNLQIRIIAKYQRMMKKLSKSNKIENKYL